MRGALLAAIAAAGCAVLGCGVARVAAQTAAPAPAAPPVSATEPQITTATYGDWVLRCQRAQAGGQARYACEIAQTLEAEGKGVVAQIALGRPSSKESMRLTVVLPPNIALPSVVQIAVAEHDSDPAELHWKRCLPGSCVAAAEIGDGALHAWRAQSGSGQIRYVVASGQPLVVAFSFRGLAAALDNLAKAEPTP
jgi:invasion protein IalB